MRYQQKTTKTLIVPRKQPPVLLGQTVSIRRIRNAAPQLVLVKKIEEK